jgi:two-component sensor histidine kinase
MTNGDGAGAGQQAGDHGDTRNDGSPELAQRHGYEADHRIKNNLQIVSGFVRSATARVTDAQAAAVLAETAARIDAIARIHEALLEGSGDVDFDVLLENVCRSLRCIVEGEQRVAIVTSSEPMRLPARLAQSLLLAMSELVINAVRHAFKGGRSGSILVTARRLNGMIYLDVRDDGPGLDPSVLEKPGHGLRIVKGIAAQLGGKVSVRSSAGALFVLACPDAPRPA